MPSCLPICGKSSMKVDKMRSGSGVTAEAGEEFTSQKEPVSWPEAPKGYPPRPPPIDDFVSAEQLQREVSLTERAGDSESQVESPAGLRTADSSPAPVSTVEVLEQLANTPDLWKGPVKVDRGNGGARKPPRAPPVEDTLKTSWSARERSDSKRRSGGTDDLRGTPRRGRSTSSRGRSLRRKNSGSSGTLRTRSSVGPRLSELEASPVSPDRRRCGNLGRFSTRQDSLMMRKVVVKNADMSEEMQKEAIECARQALDEYEVEKDMAGFIKKEFDRKYKPTWHCIVGRHFGSFVTYEKNCFIYFYSGQVAVLLFKSG